MAKKIVRGITDVKTITNQDFDTNNVNDLLSDGQYNYIHRKKGKNEEYHNLTDNIKTLSSDNTELLSVTNYNKTTNTALLSPKHDKQKEQLLESTRDTVTIHHGTNGTAEKTTVDTNPKKVLEHENLISNSQYVTIEHEEDSNISEIKTDNLDSKLIELDNKIPTSIGGTNLLLYTADPWKAPNDYYQITETVKTDETLNGSIVYKTNNAWSSLRWDWGKHLIDRKNVNVGDEFTYSVYVRTDQETPIKVRVFFRYNDQSDPEDMLGGKFITQEWQRFTMTFTVTQKMLSDSSKLTWVGFEQTSNCEDGKFVYYACNKLERGNIATDYSPAPEDIYPLLAQKQDVLTAGTGITIQGQTISASGGTTSSIQFFSDTNFKAYKHRVQTSDGAALTTLSFECYNAAETVLTGDLKLYLEDYVLPNTSISNGAISITYDGTTMKLINSSPSENVIQHATFTFNGNIIN